MKSYLRTLLVLVAAFVAVGIWTCQSARRRFDDHVIRLMEDCDAGRHREVYDRAAKSLKTWTSFETFRTYMQARREEFGAFDRLGRTRSAGGGGARSRHAGYLEVDLWFEGATRTGDFHFVKEGGAWRLSWFMIPMSRDGPSNGIPPDPPRPARMQPGGK